jgi:hypothetical protein
MANAATGGPFGLPSRMQTSTREARSARHRSAVIASLMTVVVVVTAVTQGEPRNHWLEHCLGPRVGLFSASGIGCALVCTGAAWVSVKLSMRLASSSA